MLPDPLSISNIFCLYLIFLISAQFFWSPFNINSGADVTYDQIFLPDIRMWSEVVVADDFLSHSQIIHSLFSS